MFKDLIDGALILSDLEASQKAAAVDEIFDALVASERIAKKERASLRKRLIDREALGSTGIGNGVAVPHVKGKEIQRLFLVLARSKQGIAFDAIDGKPVHTIFLIMGPQENPETHLKALRWVSSLARNADFRRFMLTASDEHAIRELLVEMSQS
jgi:mannitol/fructose-specific phosphotransferase system IIA component (Ntr-type)